MADRLDTTKYWVWKNGMIGDWQKLIAYDKEYPVYPDGGDPLTLGEPVFSGTKAEISSWRPLLSDIDFRHARGRDD